MRYRFTRSASASSIAAASHVNARASAVVVMVRVVGSRSPGVDPAVVSSNPRYRCGLARSIGLRTGIVEPDSAGQRRCSGPIAQKPSQDLAARRLRDLVDELHQPDPLVRAHVLGDELLQLLGGET